MQWSTGHSTSCEPISWLNSKRSGREPGSSIGRPSQRNSAWRHSNIASRPIFLVEQHAIAGPAVGDPRRRLYRQHLEGRDALVVGAAPCRPSPRAGCDGRWQAPSAAGCRARRVVAQWTWLIASSLRSARCLLPCFEEILQLGPGRIFRRAEQARHRKGAAGIGPGRRRSPAARRPASRAGSPDMKASPAPSTL